MTKTYKNRWLARQGERRPSSQRHAEWVAAATDRRYPMGDDGCLSALRTARSSENARQPRQNQLLERKEV